LLHGRRSGCVRLVGGCFIRMQLIFSTEWPRRVLTGFDVKKNRREAREHQGAALGAPACFDKKTVISREQSALETHILA
jgi:hypothetical protein